MITIFEIYKNEPQVMIDSSGSMASTFHDHLEDNPNLVFQSDNFYVLYTQPLYFVYEIKSKNGVCTCKKDGEVIQMTGTPYSEELENELNELIEKIPMLKDMDKFNL